VKTKALKNIKRFSHHGGNDKIRQNVEAQSWNGLGSECALDISINGLELISEGIWHLRKKKQTGVTDFTGD
jgi:hypothetical protein